MEYYLIFGLFFLSILFLLFLLYLVKNKGLIVLNIFIPLIFSIILSFYFTFESIKSRPVRPFDAEITYLDHYEKDNKIYVWVTTKDIDYPITVVMPSTKENKKKLNESKEIRKKGGKIKGNMKGKKLSDSIIDDGSMDLKIIDPSVVLPPKVQT